MFKQKDAHKTTWTHPRSRHGHMIDFIITGCRDEMDICSTRTMRGANSGTDHQMLRSRVIFSIRRKHNQKGAMKPVKLNTSKLRNTSHAESLVQEMDNALAQSSKDKDTPCWTSFQQVLYDTAKASLGKHEKKHQDWVNPNDQILRDLMAKRDQAHQRVLQIRSTRSAVQAYKDACRILQQYTRARKSEWWEMKAEELQRAADRNDMKGFYSGLKEVWGPQTKQHVHLKSSDGLEIFTDSKSVMARWSEYFQKLLNVPGDIEPKVLENIQSAVSILLWMRNQLWMRWLERSRD